MLNELHTLLINRVAGESCFSPWERDQITLPRSMVDSRLFVEPSFTPATDSLTMTAARGVVFGQSPDYHYLSHRVSQIRDLVFCSKYDELLTPFDRRVTYSTNLRLLIPLYRESYSSAVLGRFSGRLTADDANGRSLFSARILLSPTDYTVTAATDATPNIATPYGTAVGSNTWLVEQSSGVAVSSVLTVSVVSRPNRSLRQIVELLQGLSQGLLAEFNAVVSYERYIAVTNLLHDDTAWYDKLVAYLIIMAEITKAKL